MRAIGFITVSLVLFTLMHLILVSFIQDKFLLGLSVGVISSQIIDTMFALYKKG